MGLLPDLGHWAYAEGIGGVTCKAVYALHWG